MLSLNKTSNIQQPSSAEKLIIFFTNDPTTSYVMMFRQFNSGLLTIKSCTKQQNWYLLVEDCVDNSADTTDDPITFASAMRGNLSTSDGELMLACCWVSDELRRNFDMFSEVLGGDNTEQINAER